MVKEQDKQPPPPRGFLIGLGFLGGLWDKSKDSDFSFGLLLFFISEFPKCHFLLLTWTLTYKLMLHGY